MRNMNNSDIDVDMVSRRLLTHRANRMLLVRVHHRNRLAMRHADRTPALLIHRQGSART
jgi:hypothetical protein